MTQRVLIATSNPGKRREIEAMMGHLPVAWVALGDLPPPPIPEPREEGETFEANADQKALYYAERARMWALADDSGLAVDALGGAPGIHSARYSGTGDDAANNRKLVRALEGVPADRRTARFICSVSLAKPGAVVARARGTIEGEMIDKPRGAGGFGYDPHFYVPELAATTAELSAEQKNRVSHRGRALRALLPQLEALWSDPSGAPCPVGA